MTSPPSPLFGRPTGFAQYDEESWISRHMSSATREALREKGQFWTPGWVAEAMVEYVLAGRDDVLLFDPAWGRGLFSSPQSR